MLFTQGGSPPHSGEPPTLAVNYKLGAVGPSFLNNTAPRRNMGIYRLGANGYV